MSPKDEALIERLRGGKNALLAGDLDRAAERIETLARLDREAGTYVEAEIALRTDFTGEPPYVGWQGLGLALTEALDERDALRAAIAKARGDT